MSLWGVFASNYVFSPKLIYKEIQMIEATNNSLFNGKRKDFYKNNVKQ